MIDPTCYVLDVSTSPASTALPKHEVPTAFNGVSHRYDLFTALNPGYNRHLRLSASRLELPDGGRLLDLCCGTGLSTAALRTVYPAADIVALDASEGMLEQARAKRHLKAEFVLGDAMDPAAVGIEGEFDGILMAYGIRNVPDPDVCLQNLLPLLRPGGTICFHEYSVAGSKRSQLLWNAICLGVIIPGGLFAGGAKLYRYLRQSVNQFDSVQQFEARLARAGFVGVHTDEVDGWQRGIVHSFLAERPLNAA